MRVRRYYAGLSVFLYPEFCLHLVAYRVIAKNAIPRSS
jgi:hypothetical protein